MSKAVMCTEPRLPKYTKTTFLQCPLHLCAADPNAPQAAVPLKNHAGKVPELNNLDRRLPTHEMPTS